MLKSSSFSPILHKEGCLLGEEMMLEHLASPIRPIDALKLLHALLPNSQLYLLDLPIHRLPPGNLAMT